MRSFLCSTALFLIFLTTAIPILAECPEGKSEVVLYTPSGNANMLCVSDNALPGIENANTHTTLDACEEVTCPCWDAETLENLPDIIPQPDNPVCGDVYEVVLFTANLDYGSPQLAVWDDYANHHYGYMSCVLYPNIYAPWEPEVRADNLSHAETYACAQLLRASKWWDMCSEVQY